MKIGIIGCGMMGAAVGALLQDRGGEVLMLLEGRGPRSLERAQAANLRAGSIVEVGACDFVLSIVPPDAATPAVEDLLPHLSADSIFVECNAIAPDEARQICARITAAGRRCADGGIVGPAPSLDGKINPVFYVSGDDAPSCGVLRDFGLRLEVLDAPFGSASALKMAFAGLSKSVTALMGQMLAYADGEQVLEPVLGQFRQSHPGLVGWAERQFPLLDQKAGRWVQEMEILSALTAGVPGGQAHFTGMAQFYAAVAANPEGPLLTGLQRALAKG